MKNIYRVSRPAWTEADTLEKKGTFIVAVAIVIVGLVGESIYTHLLALPINPLVDRGISILIDVVATTVGCRLLIRWYKRQRVRCYPSTYLYCFYLPEDVSPNNKSLKVGYCTITADAFTGQIIVTGASYDWDNGTLDPNSQTPFESTRVIASQEGDNSTCEIDYHINEIDPLNPTRTYQHGQLRFQLNSCASLNGQTDQYAGYWQKFQEKGESEGIIHSKGYAEWYGRGIFSEKHLRSLLMEKGDLLFGSLDSMLRAKTQPSLWRALVPKPIYNSWGLHIPTPQDIILSEHLATHIDVVLRAMMDAYGFLPSDIARFVSYAKKMARTYRDDTLAFERTLKRGLVGLLPAGKEDEALATRANIIYQEIAQFCTGDSLLDIGCGNGRISNLARAKFQRILLLDVVTYVSSALGLPFSKYKETDPLPIAEKYDTVLLLTVLHHSTKPESLLQLAWEATNKRLIIIESVVGVTRVHKNVQYDLANSPLNVQVAHAAFVDWFYNRVLHNDVPVPYNFTTPEIWQTVFMNNNMSCKQTIYLGQDIAIGPEYHIMFVLDK
jgi:SAM-dependent methyltransferase